MNAANPTGEERDYEALRRAQRAHEPSMEEILASIRAIIADDREPPAPAKPAAPMPPQIVYSNNSPAVSSRPAAATIAVIAPAPEPPAVEPPREPVKASAIDAPPRQRALTPSSIQDPPPSRHEAFMPPPRQEGFEPIRPEPEKPLEAPGLLSEEADQSVAASFEALSASVAARSAELVEQMTRDMLRPMIKGWLDQNLPAMVERLVRAEIQRVARGQR